MFRPTEAHWANVPIEQLKQMNLESLLKYIQTKKLYKNSNIVCYRNP